MPIATEKLTNRFFVMITKDKMPRQHLTHVFPQDLNCTKFGRMNDSIIVMIIMTIIIIIIIINYFYYNNMLQRA